MPAQWIVGMAKSHSQCAAKQNMKQIFTSSYSSDKMAFSIPTQHPIIMEAAKLTKISIDASKAMKRRRTDIPPI